MEKNKYKDLVARHTPKEPRLYHGMIAFLTGGMMGVIGQFLIDVYSYYYHISTSNASVFMIITLVFEVEIYLAKLPITVYSEKITLFGKTLSLLDIYVFLSSTLLLFSVCILLNWATAFKPATIPEEIDSTYPSTPVICPAK